MAILSLRRWVSVFKDRSTIAELRRPRHQARLALERLEGRDVPSNSIPLNGNTWTEIGPRPIVNGQAPGSQAATGRFDSVVAVPSLSGVPGEPDILFAASVVSGIWRSLDGGNNWSPRIEFFSTANPVDSATLIRAVPRDTTNTVYALSRQGFNSFFYLSTNNGDTFTQIAATTFTNRLIKEFVVVKDPANPNDQTKDVIYAAVQYDPDPAVMPPPPPTMFPSGIYRSKDGGQTWVNITQNDVVTANFPYASVALKFSDIDIDPSNSNVLYASIDSGPEAGLYRCTNGFTTLATNADPAQWNVRLGGAAFFSGVIPEKVQTSLASKLPGMIFTAMYNAASLQILYRSTDTGINWTPILGAAFQAGGTVPDFAGGQSANYGVFEVSSLSDFNPNQQILYAAGFGDVAGNAFISRNSGVTWQDISIGPNGAGPYAGIHNFSFDSAGRMLVASQGGIYRLNSENPVIWQSLNGQPGLTSLSSIQVGGLGLHPTDSNRAIANIGLPVGTAAGQHTAAIFNDSYGWRTVDQSGGAPFSTGLLNRDGTGTVIYDFNTPNTVYRATPWDGTDQWIRRSNDGGLTWLPVSDPALPISIARDPLIINPSDSRQLLYAADDVYLYNRNAVPNFGAWVAALGAPTIDFVDDMGQPAPGQITAFGMSRQDGVIYIATTPGYLITDIPVAPPDPPPPPPPAATKLFAFNIIANTWVELTPPTGFGTTRVTAITVDPNNRFNFYMTTADGRVYNQRKSPLTPPVPPPPSPPSVKWATNFVQINPTGGANMPPLPAGGAINAIVVDPFLNTAPNDDVLYAATNRGVFRLNNPSSNAPFVWQLVGGNTLPNVPVTDLDLNTTTGILAVSLNGRGVWELQIRSLIRGEKFIDANGDGVRNGEESGVPGFVIGVRDMVSNTIIATTTTDVNGNYEFRSITPGMYRIEEVLPPGWIKTTPDVPTFTIAPTANDVIVGTYTGVGPPPAGVQVIPELNIGNYRANSISGIKFNDVNQNGVRDIGEQGAPGFVIYIDSNDNSILDWIDGDGNSVWNPGEGEQWVRTDANGNYTLANLGPAVVNGLPSTGQFSPFRIREVQQPGWNQISVNPTPIDALSGEVFGGINFGNVRPGAIRGRKILDTNSNGALDAGEVGIPNFVIYIDTNLNGVFDSGEPNRTTDANGYFEFAGMTPGTYRVREVQQPGYKQTTPNPADIVFTSPTDVVSNVLFGNVIQILPWVETGPRPITNGQSPGRPASTGRFDSVASVSGGPGQPDTIFAASFDGGIWRSLDGGLNWTPRTDSYNINNTPSNSVTSIKVIARSTGNTVYAASSYLGDGFVYISTDNGETFRPSGLTDFINRRITEIAVVPDPADPTNPAKDLIYAAVQFAGTSPPDDPTLFPGGVYRSKNGGLTWENISAFGFPFNADNGFPNAPQLLTFSDIDVDPNNREIVYVSVNSGAQAGVYRATNGYSSPATSGSPVDWQLRLGGSSFFTGTLPARVQTTISPVLSSVIFVTVSEVPPLAGSGSFITLYRTADTGVNWTPLLSTAFSPSGTIPDYTDGLGYIFNSIGVSPGSPLNPNNQIIFAGGFGDTGNNVMFSTNSGTTWTNIAVGQNGTGPYAGIRGLNFDSQNRLLLATEGGVYRLNSTSPANWASLNGTAGSGALNSYQVAPFGLGLHPFNGNQYIANSPVLHTAVRVTAPPPYAPGQTIDSTDTAPFINPFTNRWGSGEVIYDFNNPNTVYRSTDKLTQADVDWLRRSDDGGTTWRGIADAAIPFRGPLVINPSDSRELLIGADDLYLYNSAADAWFTGGTGIPSLDFIAGPGTITAIGWSRQNQLIYVATTAGQYDPFDPFRTRIYLLDRTGVLAPDWIELSRPVSLAPTEIITQLLVDPNNPFHVFFITDGGQVFDQRDNSLDVFLNPNPPAPFNAIVTWVQLNQSGFTNVPPQALVANAVGTNAIGLDPNIATNPLDDILFLGTNNGVYSLLIVPNQTENFVWQRVGGVELPNTPVSDIDVNTTTGILGVGLSGRGVWEFQIRSKVQGRLFEDINGNGAFDIGEPGIAGFVMQLKDTMTNSIVASTVTDAQGNYEFLSVAAGSYVAQPIQQAGFVQTTAAVPPFTVGLRDTVVPVFNGTPPPGTQVIPELIIGVFRPGTIGGLKFEDRNGNGTRETGEPGLSGFVIYIDANGNNLLDWTDANGNNIWDAGEGEQWGLTNATGSYSLTNIGPQFVLGLPVNPPYAVKEIQQLGFQQTSPNPTPFTITSGENRTGVNFGNIRIGRIEGFIFDDKNGDGIRQTGDVGVGGFTLELVNATTGIVFRTLVSDPDGSYEFLSIPAGNYLLREVVPTGWILTFPAPPDPIFYTINLGPTDQVAGFEFGNFKRFGVSGVKFEDLNGNGTREAGENGVPNFVIQVTNTTTGLVSQVATDALGNYSIPNLGPGNYTIEEVQKVGWTQTTPNPPAFIGTSGANLSSVDFGNFRLVAATGTVFNDTNGNGVRDPGEVGAAGFIIRLDRDNNGTVDATTTSDINGNYSFGNLGPGTYLIRQQPRRGWTIVAPASGTYSFTAVSSINPTGLDFANTNTGIYAVGRDAGAAPTVSVRRVSNNQEVYRFNAYTPTFKGGVRVATGFTEGTPQATIVTGAGPGGGPHVRVFNADTGVEVWSFFAYDSRFAGGVFVAVGDVDGDGFDDVITGADAGGGPHVKVFSGQTHLLIASFFAYTSSFLGGVRVAAADVDGDGMMDVITGAGPGGGPHVRVFKGPTMTPIRSFFAYSPSFTGGVTVSGGDFNGDGKADIVTGAGAGGGPHVRVFNGTNLAELAATFPYESTFNGGVRVFAMDVNFDNRMDLVTGPGPGRRPTIASFSLNGNSLQRISQFDVFESTFLGGVWVG